MKNKIVELIAANVEGLTAAEIADLIEIPPKPELGDFAFPCFRLAKTMRKAPQMIANDIKEAIGDVDFLQEIQVQGAYLNFFVKKELFIETMVTASMADDFGSSTEGNGQTICIDYSRRYPACHRAYTGFPLLCAGCCTKDCPPYRCP